ncbi:unnamed protein product [Cunninghamella echinulata]
MRYVFTQECGPLQQKSCDEFANKHKIESCDAAHCCLLMDNDGNEDYCDEFCDKIQKDACNGFLKIHDKIKFCHYIGGVKSICGLI